MLAGAWRNCFISKYDTLLWLFYTTAEVGGNFTRLFFVHGNFFSANLQNGSKSFKDIFEDLTHLFGISIKPYFIPNKSQLYLIDAWILCDLSAPLLKICTVDTVLNILCTVRAVRIMNFSCA